MRKINQACIIDDDKIFTFGLKKLMSLTNFCDDILTFVNGQEAINYLQSILALPESLPDLILLDLNMPIMDGWQFLEEFSRRQPAKKIALYVVSSSIDPVEHRRVASYEVVSNFFVKPLMREDLDKIAEDLGALVQGA
jgi:CheY-like chemotaxis protein